MPVAAFAAGRHIESYPIMSMARAQQLAAQSIAAVADGKNLEDVLADIALPTRPHRAGKRRTARTWPTAWQRYAGSLRFMLAQMLNKPINNAQLQKACYWRPCINCTTPATHRTPWLTKR